MNEQVNFSLEFSQSFRFKFIIYGKQPKTHFCFHFVLLIKEILLFLLIFIKIYCSMGRVFLEHMGGWALYNCRACNTNLTNKDQLISSR